MPPRAPIFEFTARNFVCRPCLSTLQNRTAAASWPSRHSSHAAEAAAPPTPSPSRPNRLSPEPARESPRARQTRPGRRLKTASPSSRHSPSAKEEDERAKIMDTLGLSNLGPKVDPGSTVDPGPKVSVNYFEQGKRGKIHRVEGNDMFALSRPDDDPELESQLEEMDETRRDPESQSEEMDETRQTIGWLKKLVKSVVGERPGQQEPEPDAVSENLPETSYFVPTEFSDNRKQQAVKRLNRSLRQCHRDLVQIGCVAPNAAQGLWERYRTARVHLRKRWAIVPRGTWDLLWRVLAAEGEDNPRRLNHVYHLVKDIQEAGLVLNEEQQLLAIEAMFVEGWQKEAIENHRRFVSTLGSNPETSIDFWRLGLRMYCSMGDMESAERVVDTISSSSLEKDPRFILPFIRMCVERPAELERGFQLYRQLRAELGDSMDIEDYDKIIANFLVARNVEYALFVFVDMMKAGTIDLATKSEYPASVNNPFFFGKWLKRLVGNDDYDGALDVIDFMRSRGVVARPMHINVLIGAWLRSGTAENTQKAEAIAWAMINTRVEFVEIRRRSTAMDAVQLKPLGLHGQRSEGYPRATLETFQLLALSFKERSLHGKMEELWAALRASELAPDVFMMNQLLASLLQEGRGKEVPDVYRGMMKRHGIKPDSWTFLALFRSLPINRLNVVPSKQLAREAEEARAMFREMMGQLSTFLEDGHLRLDIHLATFVLHTFRIVQDKVGLLLAYRALRKVFNFQPTPRMVLEILVGTKNIEKTIGGPRRQLMIKAQSSIESFLASRVLELRQEGKIEAEAESLPDEMMDEEIGNYMEMRLESDIRDPRTSSEEVQAVLLKAAEEMGLYEPGEQPLQLTE
ncbi:hypothetical protein GGR56DRAFT_621631 [Xylariaceae sp. FL0804]|nr:hypothetical protein GGR56DRAFT_621631 [Xylariaceae sp. FL0804]